MHKTSFQERNSSFYKGRFQAKKYQQNIIIIVIHTLSEVMLGSLGHDVKS